MNPQWYCKTCDKIVPPDEYTIGHKCLCGTQLILAKSKKGG